VVANSSPRQTHERRVLHEGASFAFCAGISRGWARAAGHRVSRSLHRRVARTPPLADRMGRKSLRVSPRQGAGLRLRRARWRGHYPRGRERWGGKGAVLPRREVFCCLLGLGKEHSACTASGWSR
jgi:hypothetical protein